MVAETRESMQRMFESFNDGVKTMMDAGQRTQQAWFKAFSDTWKQPGFDFDNLYTRNERFAQELGPFVSGNVEMFAQTIDTGMRTGLEMFQTAWAATGKPEEGDFYKRSRRVMDKAFDAFRVNVETASRTGAKTIENWSAFVDGVFCGETLPRSAPKAGKAGA